MHIAYNGITLTMLTLEEFSQTAVYDDSKTDKLYDRFYIQGTFIVNGQVEARLIAEPPVSYAPKNGDAALAAALGKTAGNIGGAFGNVIGSTLGSIFASLPATNTKSAEAVRHRPPGIANPGNVNPSDTNGAARQLGAARDLAAEVAQPFAAGNFGPGRAPPAFASDREAVLVLEASPNSPALTEKLIRTRLMAPRGQLFVFAGVGDLVQDLLLQSPGWGAICDAKNGPLPIALDFVSAHGEGGTFIVRWSCETFSNEQYRTNRFDPLLSNRFSVTHQVNDDHFLFITVKGRALFDTRILHARGINPDAFRPSLFQPIPLGFVRGNIEVEGLPGMEGVDYSYTDKQLPISFPAGPFARATQIEVQHRQYAMADGNVVKSILGTYDTILNRRWLKQATKEDREMQKALTAAKVAHLAARTAAIKKKAGIP